MDDIDDDNDIGELYADVEVQVSSAISAIQALPQWPPVDNEVCGSVVENRDFQEVKEGCSGVNAGVGEEEDEGTEGEEESNGNESESEDDFDILLNDYGDNDNDNGNGNVDGERDEFLSGGNGGMDGNYEKFVIEEEKEGNYGVENGGRSGCQRGSGGGCTGGYNLQYKLMRSNSTIFSSNLKSNVSTGVASYYTSARGDCENGSKTYHFETGLIGSQHGHNFSLPRSRTILDVNIDILEQKPWRNPGADITEFFNFGFNEDSWKSYCNHLDRYREQPTKVTRSSAYQHVSCNKEHKAGNRHETATENIVHCDWREPLSLTSEVSRSQLHSEMGRAIPVEDGIGERRPSVETRLPVERDSDVVIEIHIQDLEEDHWDSNKVAFDEKINYLHEASGNKTGVNDAGNISASEDGLPVLEGSTERIRESDPQRHTSTGDGDRASLDSDNRGSRLVSDANEPQHEVVCDSDGQAGEIKASDEPEGSIEWAKPTKTSERTPESSKGRQRQQSQSTSQSHSVGSKGAYADVNKLHDHLKRASSSSTSDLRESITFDHHSSKDSRIQGVSLRSGYYEHAARSKIVRRNIKFQWRRSSRISGLKNCTHDESASYMSDAEELHAKYPAVGGHRQRSSHHNLDSYEDKDYLHLKESEHFVNYRGTMYPGKDGNVGYPHGSDNQDFQYQGDQYPSRCVNRKYNFPQRRNARLTNELEREWYHYRKGISVLEMDSSNYDELRQLITEKSSYFGSGNHTRSKRKPDELHCKRRMKDNDFSAAENNSSNEFTQENYHYNSWDRDYLENRHDGQLPYCRTEVKIPSMSRRYGSPIHGSVDIWHIDCEDDRSRYTRNQLLLRSYKEPQTAGTSRRKTSPFSRVTMLERHGRRQNRVLRYKTSNKLYGHNDGYVNDGESIQGYDDHNNFARKRHYWQSEILQLSGEGHDSRCQEDNFKAGVASYPFRRTSRYKIFDHKPGPGHKRKLINGVVPKKGIYKLPIDGDRCSLYDQSSNSVHRDNFGQALPSCWDSTDSHIVLGDGKSSRCFEVCNKKPLQKNASAPRVATDFIGEEKFHNESAEQNVEAEELENPRIMDILAKMEKRRERFQQPISVQNLTGNQPKSFADSSAKTVETMVQRPARKRKWDGS